MITKPTLSQVHDEWCSRMQKEGWVYGHDYNEEKKQHPYLIRYDKLPADATEFVLDRQGILNG